MATMNYQNAPEPVYPKSHVGFDSITSQIEKKLLKRGFQFNVICVGTLASRPQLLVCHADRIRAFQVKPAWASRL
jgi:hypothetical protein